MITRLPIVCEIAASALDLNKCDAVWTRSKGSCIPRFTHRAWSHVVSSAGSMKNTKTRMSMVALVVVVFDRLGNCIANFIFAMREYYVRVQSLPLCCLRMQYNICDEGGRSQLREISFDFSFLDCIGIRAKIHLDGQIINRVINSRIMSDTSLTIFLKNQVTETRVNNKILFSAYFEVKLYFNSIISGYLIIEN